MKLFSLLMILGVTSATKHLREFPKNFKFGTATAAYQIEGAWNVSDKAEQIWDHYTHNHNENIKDRSNGDVACDSYHLYKRDVQMLVELGVDYYRFSISWSRLLPEGYGTNVSQDGLRYYNNLIDELIKYNITPMATLFHWDTPQKFMKIGGWTNPNIVDYFEDYAKLAFQHFGDRVKSWLTFNEPFNMCLSAYGTSIFLVRFAPDLNVHGLAEYQCSHNILRAHANVYHLYNNTFKPTQQGEIGMATVVIWAVPETDSEEDKAIAEKAVEFQAGWYLNPIHTPEGDYPKIMREEIDRLSKLQGFKHSRLPYFTPEEVQSLKNTADFIGINYYTSLVYRNDGRRADRQVPSYENDMGHIAYQPEEWDAGFSTWLKIRPDGLRDTLNWVKKKYGDQEIYITEIGYSSDGGLIDEGRVDFFNKHLEATLDAIDDGVNVTHFTTWSLMDNFEWMGGYTERFGLYQVDFTSPQKTRKPRMSAVVLHELFRTRKLDPDYRPEFELPVEAIEEFPAPILQITIILFTFILLPAVCLFLVIKFVSHKKKTRQSSETETKSRSFAENVVLI